MRPEQAPSPKMSGAFGTEAAADQSLERIAYPQAPRRAHTLPLPACSGGDTLPVVQFTLGRPPKPPSLTKKFA